MVGRLKCSPSVRSTCWINGGAVIFGGAVLDAAVIQRQCAVDFQAMRLLPEDLTVAYRDADFEVERVRQREPSGRDRTRTHRGAQGCLEALGELAGFWSTLGERRFEVKIFRAWRKRANW